MLNRDAGGKNGKLSCCKCIFDQIKANLAKIQPENHQKAPGVNGLNNLEHFMIIMITIIMRMMITMTKITMLIMVMIMITIVNL